MSVDQKPVRGLILTVNYGRADSTVAFLESLTKLKRLSELAVLVVDNSSGDHSVLRIREAIASLPNVQLLQSPTNRGYFGAARFAYDQYLARGNPPPDWLIVCNHDVSIGDTEFFDRLFGWDPLAVGVIAPRLRALPLNLNQNPFMRRRPGRLRRAIIWLSSSSYFVARLWDWLSRQKRRLKSLMIWGSASSDPSGEATCASIYAAHGAFMIFSRRYFEAGGYLDANLFLYGEEISVAEICRSLRLPLVYDPALCVLHREHLATGQTMSRFSYECQRGAIRYVLSRYWPTARACEATTQRDSIRSRG